MKLAIILAILMILLLGCSPSEPTINTTPVISGIQELMLDEKDLDQLRMTTAISESDIQMFELSNGTNCRTDEEYTNILDSSIGQYNICVYNIPSLNNTQIIIELQKFANYEALNNSYQYGSSHLYSVEGIISENDYGDQSTFRVNNENDYMGNLNNKSIYYYHLWFTKDEFMVHITSKGSEEAERYIADTGQLILSKFG
ncbi:MAG: hypothetical protein KJ601_06870 [Nanoarchaeota archaeon]|nr:hypothetical protein [Nanoarchaeota archaeon]